MPPRESQLSPSLSRRQGARPGTVIVVGGGVTGLVAAYELTKKARREGHAWDVTVLEASSRLGGKVVTDSLEAIAVEGGPDSFVTYKPQALELARELGFEHDLLKTDERCQRVYVYSGGALRALPAGLHLVVPTKLWPFLFSGLLSLRGRLRVLREAFMPPAPPDHDESVSEFIRRRLGDEALERVAGPILAGIYAGDPDQLSLASTFPQLAQMEREGGLLRAAGRRAAARVADARTTMFMTLKGGLERLTQGLADRLPPGAVRTGARVDRLERRGGGWIARAGGSVFNADAVISALPASGLAEAVFDLDPELAQILREIPFASSATAALLYRAADVPRLPDGFGFVVPRAEGKSLVAVTFVSKKFPGRVPAGSVVIRCFIGGAGREPAAEADEDEIAALARRELAEVLGSWAAKPSAVSVRRWTKANPQYTIGHGLRLRRLASSLRSHPGLSVAGCSFEGVGLPDCVESGRRAAAAAAAHLLSRRRHGH